MDEEVTMSRADLIWNRAALEQGGPNPRPGDEALASMLLAHGLTMNGGVLHAAEALLPGDLAKALESYSYFGLSGIAEVFERAQSEIATPSDEELADEIESQLDADYHRLVPSDDTLVRAFERTLSDHPMEFAKL